MAEKKFGWDRDDTFSDYDLSHEFPSYAGMDKPSVARQWPLLSRADITRSESNRHLLAACIVERYGISLDWAARQIADWEASAISGTRP